MQQAASAAATIVTLFQSASRPACVMCCWSHVTHTCMSLLPRSLKVFRGTSYAEAFSSYIHGYIVLSWCGVTLGSQCGHCGVSGLRCCRSAPVVPACCCDAAHLLQHLQRWYRVAVAALLCRLRPAPRSIRPAIPRAFARYALPACARMTSHDSQQQPVGLTCLLLKAGPTRSSTAPPSSHK